MVQIPTGTVTFLFTDIEGSTQLLHRFGDRYSDILAEHQRIIRKGLAGHAGFEVNTDGDAFFIAFASAAEGIAAAVTIQKELAEHAWPENTQMLVRMALHTGEPTCTGDDYGGLDVHRGARIRSAAHGAQVLLSAATKTLAGNRIPEGVTFRDLGEHRMKDLERPEHLFQLVIPGLRSDFPPILSLNNCPNNLPARITPLIGRDKELAQVCELLRRADVRFVTLSGPGGVGKTLLALQIANSLLADFADGAFIVNLSVATDAGSIATQIAEALGAEAPAGQPLIGRIIKNLRERRILLLLDNLEQVAHASSETVSAIVEACPHVKILGTSRTPLSVRSEQVFHVNPLPVPSVRSNSSPASVLSSPAVRLFIERAKTIKRDLPIEGQNLTAIAQICARLDGLPLAIELAAARIKLLSPQELLVRLSDPANQSSLQLLTGGARDLPVRQQTIRNTIAWSYNLLDANCQKLFCRLSIFAGGCTLATAEAVCSDLSNLQIEAVDGIATLIDNNLLQQEDSKTGEPRIRFLRLIREFGLEQLTKSRGDGKAYRALATHLAAFAEKAEASRTGPDFALWAERVETEHDNFRTALAWSIDNAPELALRIIAGVGEFWFRQGHWNELSAACEKVLVNEPNLPAESAMLRARCLRFAGQSARVFGDPARAKKFFEQSLTLSQQHEIPVQMVEALNELGGILLHAEGDNSRAQALFDQALQISRKTDDENHLADTIFQLGDLALVECNFEDARDKFEQAAAICRKRGYSAGIAQCMSYLATVAISVGDYDRALSRLQVALEIHEKADEKHSFAWDRYKRGQIASARGEYTQAQIEFEDCYNSFQQMNATVGEAWCLYELGKMALDKEDLGEASTHLEKSLAIFRTLGKANSWAILQLGTMAIYEGRFRSARKLLDKSLKSFRASPVKNGVALCLCELARLARLEGDHHCAHLFLSESLELARQMESKNWTVSVFQQLAYLAGAQQMYDCSAKLLGKVERLREEMRTPVAPRDRVEYDTAIKDARAVLGEEVFTTLWKEGRDANSDQVDRRTLKVVSNRFNPVAQESSAEPFQNNR